MTLEDDLSELLGSSKKLNEFFKYISGFQNGKGGLVVIHAKHEDQLGLFDQKVDNRLQAMIPDGKLYHKVFERSFLMPNHLVYRVKPNANQSRLFSTVNFNTKVSVNKGKENPTYTQMSVLIDHVSGREPSNQTSRASEGSIQFAFEEQVMISKGRTREPFQESMTIQAKACETMNNSMENLVDYIWKDMKLNEYISAFTKIEGGGSVYFGIYEEKTEADKWMFVTDDITHILRMMDNDWEVWRETLQKKHTVYHVTEVGSPSSKKETGTGKFTCRGVILTNENRSDFCMRMQEKVRQNVLWFGASAPSDPVEIYFHEVENSPAASFVIEVKVKYYHGLCFHNSDGPESYESRVISTDCEVLPYSQPVRIEVINWIEPFLRECSSGTTGNTRLRTQNPLFTPA